MMDLGFDEMKICSNFGRGFMPTLRYLAEIALKALLLGETVQLVVSHSSEVSKISIVYNFLF